MKDVKLGLISELMRNSRRSDRELARALGVTQPTVTRARTQLEKEGYIKEYTMIPDFLKLDYKILAITLIKLKQVLSPEQIEQAKKIIGEAMKTMKINALLLERGLGLDSDGVIISYHKDYSAHVEFMELLKRGGEEFILVDGIRSFLIDLQDEVRFIPLTLSIIAHNISKTDAKTAQA